MSSSRDRSDSNAEKSSPEGYRRPAPADPVSRLPAMRRQENRRSRQKHRQSVNRLLQNVLFHTRIWFMMSKKMISF